MPWPIPTPAPVTSSRCPSSGGTLAGEGRGGEATHAGPAGEQRARQRLVGGSPRRGRHVEGLEAGASEAAARDVRHRELEPLLEAAVRAVAVDGRTTPERHPHASVGI